MRAPCPNERQTRIVDCGNFVDRAAIPVQMAGRCERVFMTGVGSVLSGLP
jgi:hypothetical protein